MYYITDIELYTQITYVFLVFVTFLGAKTVNFWRGGGRVRGGFVGGCEKKLFFLSAGAQRVGDFFQQKVKKYFGGTGKGCIFAPVFDERTTVH